jgi:hypothetical protein
LVIFISREGKKRRESWEMKQKREKENVADSKKRRIIELTTKNF